MKVFTGNIHRGSVRKMPALLQVHAHDGIAGIEQGKEDGQVGIGAGMGLYIGMIGTEELAGTLTRDVFHNVHILAAAIITFAGKAFGILVGQDGSCRGEHGRTDNILGRNQFNIPALAVKLLLAGCRHFRVELLQKLNVSHCDLLFQTPRK